MNSHPLISQQSLLPPNDLSEAIFPLTAGQQISRRTVTEAENLSLQTANSAVRCPTFKVAFILTARTHFSLHSVSFSAAVEG